MQGGGVKFTAVVLVTCTVGVSSSQRWCEVHSGGASDVHGGGVKFTAVVLVTCTVGEEMTVDAPRV